jgi:stage III sporulation protein AG
MKRLASFLVRQKKEGEKKKLTAFENLVIIVVVGVIIILAGGLFSRPGGSGDASRAAASAPDTDRDPLSQASGLIGEDIIMNLEKRLAGLLSQVEGAGAVEVMIYADSSSEMVPAYNDQLNSRSDEETGRISLESSERRELALSGDDKPVILRVEIPEIKGVVVVAEGADDFLVKQELNSAVCTLLGVPEHRVRILKHK